MRELVGVMTGGDRIVHVLDICGVVGRAAAQDVVRRRGEVAREVERPGARADMKTPDQHRTGHDDRENGKEQPCGDATRAAHQPVRMQGSP